MGTMLLVFNELGVIPRSRYFLHILYKGIAIISLHCFNRIAGKPSGQAAAFSDISLIALIMSAGLNSMSRRLSSLFGSNMISGSIGAELGLLNTELYC